MAIAPDFLHITKEQTFSSVAKEVAHLPIVLDNNYPIGGYPISSSILFNDDKFSFRMISAYARNSGGNFLLLFHDVANSKLLVVNMLTRDEIPNATDLSDFIAYCTFHRW